MIYTKEMIIVVLSNQIVVYLIGLLCAALLALLVYYNPRIKKLVDAHLTAKQAEIANNVIDGLTSIAENIVHEFNIKTVNDLKAAGNFTPQEQAKVKNDAISAVKSQAPVLVKQAEQALGPIDNVIGDMIDATVERIKYQKAAVGMTVSQPTASAQPVPTPPASAPATN